MVSREEAPEGEESLSVEEPAAAKTMSADALAKTLLDCEEDKGGEVNEEEPKTRKVKAGAGARTEAEMKSEGESEASDRPGRIIFYT